MKNIKYIFTFFVAIMMLGCETEERDLNFVSNAEAPTNTSVSFSVTQDNTGLVTLIPNADGAVQFELDFGDGTGSSGLLDVGESIDHVYSEGEYLVSLKSIAINGKETISSHQLIVSFQPPQNVIVDIQNDGVVSNTVRVNVTADFATMYEVDFGNGNNDVLSANIDEELVFEYLQAGTYTITVTVMSAAIETFVYTEEFEVTEILAPITAAPTPPFRQDADVISIYSDAYDNIVTTEFPTDWSDTEFAEIQVEGDNIVNYTNLAFTGIVTDYTNPTDLTAMEFVHFDYWTADGSTLGFKIVNTQLTPAQEDIENVGDVIQDQWVSVDIPLDDFDMDRSQVTQLLFDALGNRATVFVDNLYFYKSPAASIFNDGLLNNGDFELGSDSWIIGVNDDNLAPVTTDAGNTYYSVDVTSAGNAFDVNISQKVEIIEGNTYTLTFDAWSAVNRSIIAGIGLSGGDFSNNSLPVDITTDRTTYSLTLAATGFGAVDARVLFDLGAEIGLVNIDNVSLFVGNGNLVVNGDFQNGSDPWIVGVDDNSPAPVVTDGNNTYYSVNVTSAGNAFDVNMSQKLEIVADQTYVLTFDAWSDGNRSIIAGIGLSGGSFANTSQPVDISSVRTTYTLTLTASGFGATDARVLFDVGAETGLVNIDNVSLSQL
ncbi:carbohydrate binding domain-containing protein [Winogradskyella sp.]|uniref:carbohydrate binding domain-containing protein n=1 Tax=Winogradskyella sp. TaxID=1883156 RepID=UPI0025EA052B|nr:carbohydrate binding domain-containing protein [Winogradskyella sp.]